jgi:hypothetical protein
MNAIAKIACCIGLPCKARILEFWQSIKGYPTTIPSVNKVFYVLDFYTDTKNKDVGIEKDNGPC